ncbi:D-tyrosyl-tRNA(Tyr) deacylase [Halosquirtibacter xylanolyticus]|uniref:D-aminoacyl-tRNA deacylase n=1 Tax=Halosquirtibacter xylanolyticus TaxID=3374599 RepID=UPI0037489188|nr:D-tyrosyl-tRNA(Tyr) deacylase [Prolixibacteraceae bacterium]
MKVVLQRVLESSVKIDEKIHSQIGNGLLILLGIGKEDNAEDINWLIKKISQMRIFEDENGQMNRSILDVNGEVLIVSQFTLLALTKKGNRPSFIDAARPEVSIPLYNSFVDELSKTVSTDVKTGVFGADMKVSLINDGPVTIVIDSKNR